MTDRVVAAADSNRLAYTGGVLPAAAQARAGRRWGWWLYAEYRLTSMRAYLQTILIRAIGLPLLYLFSMGLGLGALVNAGAGGVDGVSYLVFVGPALLVSSVVMEASGEFSYPVMAGFKWQKHYFAAAASPVAPGQVAVGEVVAVGLRFIPEALLFWLALVGFGAVTSPASVLMVLIAPLAALAFGAPLMAFAATQTDEGSQFAFIQRFVVMPMFLFAGTFFPISAMPGYLQWIGWISPMWHGTQLARVVGFGMANPWWLTALHVVVLLGAAVGGTWLAARLFARRLTR
ncbi:MAG: ABC transporter permease [Micropruina sp.]|uniref:ABC transporter permease n=1 Tax=Micropruina sp. TaxID=2737536 RepID=UPI0039E3C7BC